MPSEPPRPGIERRQFLAAGAALGGAFLLKACGGEGAATTTVAVPLNRDDFIVHSDWCLETRRGDLQGLITPVERVFVRNNVPVPAAGILRDRDAWQLSVEGVIEPRIISLGELKRLGVSTVAAVLQCSGNGRAFFQHGPSGSQWGVGAAANVFWTGVPVRVLAEALGGVVEGARFLTGTGADLPEGLDPLGFGVERSVPASKGLADCLLAWEMNFEPIPLVHGGPLRLIVPGYYGVNNVKYLGRLAFTEAESPSLIQQQKYRVRPVGEEASPDQQSMWSMNVKSWITDPLGDRALTPGTLQVLGLAFAGEVPIAAVEVTLDGGATWNPARLFGPDLGPAAWRRFVLQFEATRGVHQLASRARDAEGNVQPEHRQPNERGYGNNSWRDPLVEITVT